MKRLTLTALLAAMLLLCGCAADTPAETPDTPPAATDPAVPATETGEQTEEDTQMQEKQFRTASGDIYTFDTENVGEDGTATFGTALTCSFPVPVGKDFNRFVLTYSCSKPVSGKLHYREDGRETEEVFYLESGDGMVFRSFISSFLKNGKASEITAVEISRISGSNIGFTLLDLTTECCAVPDADEVYLTGSRYRLGVRLGWGGGISYIEDLADGDDSLSNLLNRHDTGRLVQQSYYGTSSMPYKPAKYNGTTWSYNPVQGGDQYGNRSRLIDYSLSEDGRSIYIKCLPADWAQNNQPTKSYMENTYTVTDTGIRVENRFFDFSGYRHPTSHQELPAFYTVSYLSRFCFYGGSKGWTGDTLTVLPDEPFWAGQSSCYHNMNSKETWGAWVSPEGWGIGVYTPIAEILLAGRYNYNGTKSADADPTNYVAPLVARAMDTLKPFTYNYYITTGTLEEIRDTFTRIYEAEVK